jgi:hypothetical protein
MDEVFRSEFIEHGTELCHKVTQPSEDIILARNQELRKNPGAINDLGANSEETWGRQVASIPFIMWDAAIRCGYDLASKDHKTAEKELWRFLNSEEGKKCIVQGK